MRHLILGTAGHIDHGKSALVRALTGTDPDRLKEEKARGITIDLGFAHWAGGEVTFSFVDVPGHERFVRNMLAGVGGIDAVVLVVAADESVMPQTREHFEICRVLRVPDGLVALTKADLVDADMLELVRMETRELVAGSFLERAPIVPVSSKTGAGLDDLRRELAALAGRIEPRRASGAARLPIDRVFSVKGFGTVVTGTLVSGTIGVEAELSLLPAGRVVKVRGVQVHGFAEAGAVAGQRAAVNLGGVELDEVHRGHSLVTPGTLAATRAIDARLELLPSSTRGLKHGARVRFHQGTGEVLGRVALAAVLSRDEGAATAPGSEVPPGADAYVRLRLEAPAVLARGDRFIVRAYSPPVTIGGGVVLDPLPDRGPIRTEVSRQRFATLDPANAATMQEGVDRALAALVAARGPAGLPLAAVITRLGVAPADLPAVVERHAKAGTAVQVADVLAAPAVLERLGREVCRLVGDHHRAQPLLEGMPREEVRERLFARAGAGVFEQVVASLVASGTLGGRDRLALASHRVSLSPEEEAARRAIEQAYRAAGLKPPEPEAIAAEHAIDPATLERIVKLLVRQRVLVRLESLLFHEEALARLRQEMAAIKGADGPAVRLDVAAFKARLGVTRKYAIPLLEYLDRERITRRVGEGRVLL
jgi:selenocysteine-specific elongation factor